VVKNANISHISEDEINLSNLQQLVNQKIKRGLQTSNFGRICKATERTNFSSLADSLTVSKDIKNHYDPVCYQNH
jgi:hypothetical protein